MRLMTKISPSRDIFLDETGETAGFFRSSAQCINVVFPEFAAPTTAKLSLGRFAVEFVVECRVEDP